MSQSQLPCKYYYETILEADKHLNANVIFGKGGLQNDRMARKKTQEKTTERGPYELRVLC